MTAKLFVILVLFLLTGSIATEEEQGKGDREDYKKTLHKECSKSYSATCLKMDVVNFVDKLDNQEDFNILPGISLVRESSARANENIVAEVAREFPNDPNSRLDAFLLNKVANYLNTHSIKLNLLDPNSPFTGRGKGGGLGGGGKKGGGLGMMLAAGAMMKGMMMSMALAALAALAGKALMTGLISLMLSAIIGLKSLAGGGNKSTTYEIVAKPIYSHASSASHEEHGGHGYGHSSYGRSFDMPLPLGLQQGYQP